MNSKILGGTEITLSKKADTKSGFCKLAAAVRRAHDACGDSAFIHADENKAIFGVFDGVSGEAGADRASTLAAKTILKKLVETEKPGQKEIQKALETAHASVTDGLTTALVVVVLSNGTFISASVGDSTMHSIDQKGNFDIELYGSRVVGKGDTIFRFLAFRNVVKSVIGWHSGEFEVIMREGRLSPGEILIAASDALVDNLNMRVSQFNIEDASGADDLKKIISNQREPEKIRDMLFEEIKERISMDGKEIRQDDMLLAPKKDDFSVVVFRYAQ
jgi:serine/threonine protein phosphatase PrpC